MPNVKNVEALAAFIERADYKFDMNNPVANPVCGTAGCIGGHAAVLWPGIREFYAGDTVGYSFSDKKLALKLGVSNIDLINLCYVHIRYCDRFEAVARLRNLLRCP